MGRRSAKTVNGTATNFLYDGPNTVQELASGAPTANLLTGLGVDETYSRADGVGVRSYLSDALGSTIALTDASDTIKTSYKYEPYGNTSVTGEVSTNAAQYTGRENDGTGLYFYRARYYHAGFSRFVTEDPIGLSGGENLYAYVYGNPINLTDPSGRFGLWGAGIGLVSGAAAGYASGGWQGAVAGGAVGAVVGAVAPQVAGAFGGMAGAGAAGMFAAAGSTAALGAAGTVAGNALAGKCLADGLAYGTTLGALAPLMSGEAAVVGAGGEAAVGAGIANGFSALTGIFGAIGAAMAPGAEHGFRR